MTSEQPFSDPQSSIPRPPANMSLPAPTTSADSLGMVSETAPPAAKKTRWWKRKSQPGTSSPEEQAKEQAKLAADYQKQAQNAARNTAKMVARELKFQERKKQRQQEILANPDHWRNRLVDPSRITFLSAGLLLVVALVVAVGIMAIPGKHTKARLAANPKQQAQTPLGNRQADKKSKASSASPATTAAPVIAAMTSLDSDGQDSEHPEWIDRILDGDPNSKWMSRYYTRSKFGAGGGIGISVTLEAKAPVKEIHIDSTAVGGVIEVRLPSTTTYPRDGELIATGTFGPGQVITLDKPTVLDSFLLWFPELPKDPQGRFRATITNLSVK